MSNKSLFKISILQPKMDRSVDKYSNSQEIEAVKRRKPSNFKKQYLMIDQDTFKNHSGSKKMGLLVNGDIGFEPSPSTNLKKYNRLQSARIRKKDDESMEFTSIQLSSGPEYRKNKPKKRKRSYEQLRKKFPVFNLNAFMLKKQDGESEGKNQIIAFWITKNKFVRMIQDLQSSTWDLTNHQSIIKVNGLLTINNTNYIVTDYLAGNSLLGVIKEYGNYKQSLARKKIKNLVIAIINCHSRDFVHGRINPQNLWTNQDGDILLDLVKSNENIPDQAQKIKNLIYFAPQVLEQCWISPKADVWGVGCITLFMLTGFKIGESFLHPYSEHFFPSPVMNSTKREEMLRLRQIKIKYGSNQQQTLNDKNQAVYDSSYFSKQAISFIKACLSVSYKTRPDLQVLIDHPFLSNS